MPRLRTVPPVLIASVALALGASAMAGGGSAATASAPPTTSAVAGLLAGSYQPEFGRLSVAGDAQIDNKRSPAISGKARPGRTLTVTSGSWAPAKVDLTYQWFAGSKKISGAKDDSYSPKADVVGEVVSVRVTAQKKGYRSATVSDSAGVVKGGTLTATSDPVIRGAAKVGKRLRVTGGRWSASDVSLSYSWLQGRKEVGTGKTYVVKASDRGSSLRVQVRASRAGYRSGSVTTAPTDVVRH